MTKVVEVSLAGGLGNRMFQYAYARAYAERHGFELHTPPSILQRIFQINDPPATGDFGKFPLLMGTPFGVGDRDGEHTVTICGMRQHQCEITYTLRDAKRWFRLRPEMEELVKDVPSMDLVANTREGDYAYGCNPMILIDRRSYENCCDDFNLDKSKLYWLHGETHYQIPSIPIEKPWIALSDHEAWRLGDSGRLDFLPDWALLQRAKIVIRPNSTFSWWAIELSDHERVFSPNVKEIDPVSGVVGIHRYPQMVPFVDGNHMPMVWKNPADNGNPYPFVSDLKLPP